MSHPHAVCFAMPKPDLSWYAAVLVRGVLVRGVVVVVLVSLLLPGVAMAQKKGKKNAEPEIPERQFEQADLKGVRFPVDETVLTAGRTATLAFDVTEAVDEDREGTARVEGVGGGGGGGLEVVMPPRVLAGERRGFVRLRASREGVKEGGATLRVGDASLKLRGRPAAVEPVELRPVIFNPVPRAAVWGEVGVGVELFVPDAEDEPRVALLAAPAPWDASKPEGVKGLVRLEPVEAADGSQSPVRRYGFELDADKLPAGPVQLVPVVTYKDRDGSQVVGEAVVVFAVRGDTKRLLDEEAESFDGVEAPQRFRDREQQTPKLRIGKSEDASGGAFVDNPGQRPVLIVPVKVEEGGEGGGRYQVMLRVDSREAGGMLATVGVRVGNDNDPRTSGVVPISRWHRVAVGRPVSLKAGRQTLALVYENDFNRGRGNDRGLRIDRVELLRLSEGEASNGLDGVTSAAVGTPVRAALEVPLHGRVLTGDVTVRGRVSAEGDRPAQATLLLNGEAFGTLRDATPSFEVSRGQMKPGVNTFQIEAVDARGVVARSAVHEVTLAELPGKRTVEPRRVERYGIDSDRWVDGVQDKLADDRRFGGRHAAMMGEGEAVLELPVELAGRFTVRLDGFGEAFKGPPIVSVELVQGGKRTPVGEPVKVWNAQRDLRVGDVNLVRGVKRLAVVFTNDAHEPGKGDRNFRLRGVELRTAGEDTSTPAATLVYPKPGATVYEADAVVADVADDREVAWAEVLLDGEPTGMRLEGDGYTPMAVPVALRGVSSGEHTLALRVADAAGNTSDTQGVKVRVTSEEPATLGPYARAVRLLNRFGYGPEPHELAAVLTQGEEAYLREQLTVGFDDPGVRDTWTAATLGFANDGSSGEVVRRALQHLLETPAPVRGRLTMFVDNHFSTWMRKTNARNEAVEHAQFVVMGAAPFEDLLFASATSPAMLVYLDQQNSFAKRINENYAREIMELHTVGVGAGYKQNDVTELANLLTGWRSDTRGPLDGDSGRVEDMFNYDPDVHDARPRSVFGWYSPAAEEDTPAAGFDRARQAVEMLARRPETARFVSRKMIEHYVASPAPEDLVNELAEVFQRTGGDLREVLIHLALSEGVYEPGLSPRLSQPLEYAVSLQRVAGVDESSKPSNYLRSAGFGLFDRETPDGYPQDDASYADSNAMLQRWKYAQSLDLDLTKLIPVPLREPPTVDEKAKDSPEAKAAVSAWHGRVVDALAVRLTGWPLGERSREAAVGVLDESTSDPQTKGRLIGALVAQLPEASLR